MNRGNRNNTKFKVVVNHEEQYSIWVADRPNPLGWRDAPRSGSKSECLAYIREVWTDMRPLSLRNNMERPANLLKGSSVHLNGNYRKAIVTN